MILAEPETRASPAPRRASYRSTPRSRLFHAAQEFACPILSLSAGGAQVRLAHPIGIWSTVTLVIDGIGALHCRVVWQRGDTVALQFVQNAQWVTGKLLAAAS